jgi:hypothetical protein
LTHLQRREAKLVDDHSALEVEDPAAFQQDAVTLVDQYVEQLERARGALGGVRPASGEDVADALDDYLGTAIERLQSIARELRDADAGAAGFQADISTFEANLQFVARELPDPFAGVRDQPLVAAVRDEPSCAELVMITGGS